MIKQTGRQRLLSSKGKSRCKQRPEEQSLAVIVCPQVKAGCFTCCPSRSAMTNTEHLNGCAPADLLRRYFSGKLAAFSQASQNANNTSGSDEDEEEQAEAMDIGSSPQPAVSVMGQQWAHHLPQVLTFLQQLGLQVSLLCIVCPSVLPLGLDASMHHIPPSQSSSAC